MAVPIPETDNSVQWLDAEEERAFFDRQARSLLGISGEEFVRRWASGDYDEVADDPAHSDVMYLALLSTVGR